MTWSCFVIGEDTLTLQCAQILLNQGHPIYGIIARNTELARWSKEHHTPLIDPQSDLSAALRKRPFDYLFSIANLRMLPKEVLAIPRAGTINFHDGPLPRYAGIHATSWALLNRERDHGITWHLVNDVADGGKILKQQSVNIADGETAFSLNAKCFQAGLETFPELIDELSRGTCPAKEQDLSKRSYFGMWRRPDAAALISWRQPAEQISALVKALDLGPYPNRIGRTKLKIGKEFLLCPQLEVLGSANGSTAGTVTAIEPEGIRVACLDGEVRIGPLQTLSGRPVAIEEIMHRHGLRIGTELPEPTALERKIITAVNKQVCKHETFWVKRLSSLRPFSLPYLETLNLPHNATDVEALSFSISASTLGTVRALWPGYVDGDLMAAAFSLYLVRLGDEGHFDLGLRGAEMAALCDGVQDLFATDVPWRVNVDCDVPAHQGMNQALIELSNTREAATYIHDLWTRWPELRTIAEKRGVPVLPVQVQCVESIDDCSLRPGNHFVFVAARDGDCRLVYRRSALKAEQGRSIVRQFCTFLEALSNEPEKCVAELPLLTDFERNELVVGWNDTASPFPREKCKPQLFEEQVAQTPNATAVAFEEEEISYSELNARANQLGRHLRELGVGPDTVVGICVERSIEMVIGLLGIQKAGGAYLPLDPNYPKERLAFILDDADIRVLITQDRLGARMPPHRATVVRLDTEWADIAKRESTNFNSGLEPHHLAYVIYTSGSTGKPKGVMVEHRQVVSFFAGMDARLPHKPGNVWLALTSLSFDISVLELFWTLCRGFKVVIYSGEQRKAFAVPRSSSVRPMDYSLFYFSADQGENPSDKYRLLIEGAKFADENNFRAIWTPERHFHAFGGLYPNPSVMSAAIAMITRRLQIRSGSVVAPLHSPIRIAEEWSIVDNLSGGRVGLSFASGWMPDDFVIRPDNFADRKDATFRHMEIVRRLWRGDAVGFPDPFGKEVQVSTLPRPIQNELPVWITTAGNPETYEMAAKAGANVLTHLLGQTIEEVGKKIALYRQVWEQAGHTGRGCVTLMLHTFVSDDLNGVKETVREPLINYLRTSADLLKKYSSAFPAFKNQGQTASPVNFGDLAPEEFQAVLDYAFDRYFETSGLFGTPQSCLDTVEKLKAHGVDEIACLVDFGVPTDVVIGNLKHLNALRETESTDHTIGALIRRHGATHLQCTPSMARMLLADDESAGALRGLQVVMIGGEAFPLSLAQQLKKVITGRIINMYGPTETTIWSGTHELNAGEAQSIPIGRPIPNTLFYVVNRSCQPQPVGVPGELLIGGAGVARGYLNRAELTNERFISNPFHVEQNGRVYRTGDLVRYLPDGNVEFLGRIDDQVKIRGHRVELGEIESTLNRHPLVQEAVVIAREDSPGDVRLIAYIKARDGNRMIPEELREYVQVRLPEYMIPARVVQLETFPQTPNNKIDRKALPAPEQVAVEARSDIEPPSGPTETKLAEIWAGFLKVPEIGRNDDFFRLGGDSLSLIHVILKTEEVFDRKISIGSFVQARTLERVARLLEQPGLKTQTAVPNGKGAVTVRRMSETDLDDVIKIHLDYFPDWRVSMLGRRFLQKMYRWYIKTHGDLALVAAKEGRVIGFTVGTVGPYKKSLLLYALPEAVRGIAASPARLIKSSLSRVGKPAVVSAEMTDFEFANNRIMVLSESANGESIDLMLAFERAAERRGTRAYFHEAA